MLTPQTDVRCVRIAARMQLAPINTLAHLQGRGGGM